MLCWQPQQQGAAMPEGHVTYTSENLTEAVLGRIRGDAPPRTRQVLGALVRHLHAFVQEVELTPAEWEQGIAFISEIGHWCNDKRQEAILLSDILGVSMLVDAIANRSAEAVTESTVLGPFHREDAPVMPDGAEISEGIPGERLTAALKVADAQGAPIAGAEVDIWHSSADGAYDSQMGDGEEHHMRGRFHSGADGMVRFTSVVPCSYPVPHDGPAGRVLAAMGRSPMRPAHVHMRIRAPGYRTLVTHLFPAGDPYLDQDAVFGVKASLVVDLAAAQRRGQASGPHLEYEFRLPRG